MRAREKNQNGSVLILFLWVLVVLGLFSLSIAARTRLATKLEGHEHKRFQRNYDFLTAVNLARFYIEQDSEPVVDGLDDGWHGEPANFSETDFKERFKLSIADEESKININNASADLLLKLFETLRQHGVSLKTNPEDLAAAIVAWRGGGTSFGKSTLGFKHKRAPFETLDELYMMQHATAEDVRLIAPYLTVYGGDISKMLRVNINTAHPYVVEALVESQIGGTFVKKELLQKIEHFRNYKGVQERARQNFQPMDLDLSGLLTRLNLQPSVEMVTLIGQLLRHVTVDSRFFRVDVDYRVPGEEAHRMEAVLGLRGEGFRPASAMEVLAWHEGLAL